MTLVEQRQFWWHQLCPIGPKGWQRKFIPKKFVGIDSKWFSIFRRRKWSFWGIPRFTEESIPRLRTEGNGMKKKLVLQKILLQQTVFFRDSFGTEFREFVSIFVPRNRIPSCLLLFCSMEQNFEHFSPMRNGLERNSDSFLFRGTAGIPPELIICSIFSVFRRIHVIFLSEIPNPAYRALSRQALILQASCSHSLRASNMFLSFCCRLIMNHKKRQ